MKRERRTSKKIISFVLAFMLMAGIGFGPVRVEAAVTVETKDDATYDRTTATINGSYEFVDEGETIGDIGFVVNGTETLIDPKPDPGDFSLSLTSLTPGANYTYMAYVYCNGVRLEGATFDFTTAALQPEVGPTTTTTAVGGVSVTVNCTFVANDYTIVDRGFLCSDTDSYAGVAPISLGVGPSPFSRLIDSLAVGKTYYIWGYVDARLSGGSTVRFYTSSRLAYSTSTAPTVTTNYGTSTTNYSTSTGWLTMYGNITATGGSAITRNGFVYSTTVATPTLDAGTAVNATTVPTGGPFSTYISPTTSGTYYVRAFATNAAGQTGYGSVVTVTVSATPTVTTNAATSVLFSSATLNLSLPGGTTGITARGFLYSLDPYAVLVSGNANVVPRTTTTLTAALTNLEMDTTYYYRAYATNAAGTGYGEILSFTTQTDARVTTTNNFRAINNTGFNAEGNFNYLASGATCQEKGFAYSRTNEFPTVTTTSNANDGYVRTTADRTTGFYDLDITGLTANMKYYVRAYVRTSQGYVYGQVREVTTANALLSLTTSNVTTYTGTTARFTGNVTNNTGRALTEKGFVYSSTRTTPTIGDTVVKHSATSAGSYNLDVTGLAPNTTYYVRAYARNGAATADIAYGNTVTFTTRTANVAISVIYRNSAGVNCGTQTINTTEGAKLTAANLIIPSGYELVDKAWNYTVKTAETINVTVKLAGESPFMSGIGNYRFGPELPISRGEVAHIMYTLSHTPGEVLLAPLVFTDVPATHRFKAAIDYCTSKGLLSGFPGGTFQPDSSITREQMAVVLCKLYPDRTAGVASSNFPDVSPARWSYGYVSIVSREKMMVGHDTGNFGPEEQTTRAQVCTLFSNAEKRSLIPLGTAEFSDVPKTHWAYPFIMNAARPAM